MLFASAAVLAASVLAGSCGPSPAPRAGDTAAAAEAAFERTRGFSGAVAVRQRGLLIYAAASGRADRARPFTTQTVTDVASVSKTFTAATVLKLVDDGRARLDDPLSRWFPEAPPDTACIRTRTSGTCRTCR